MTLRVQVVLARVLSVMPLLTGPLIIKRKLSALRSEGFRVSVNVWHIEKGPLTGMIFEP